MVYLPVIIIIIIIIIINTVVAAQDQAISTNYFGNKILKEDIESKCRLCKQHEETIDHPTSGCRILAKSVYLMKHDKICALPNMQSPRH
jgi:hypothetical protein